MSLLVTSALLLALAIGLSGKEEQLLGRASPAFLIAAYGAPAVFLLAFVLWLVPEDAHRLRGTLLAWGLRAPQGRVAELTVGGDRETHEVWIAGFSGPEGATPPRLGTLRFDPGQPAEPPGRRLVLHLPEQVEQGTLVERHGGLGMRPIPSLRLEEGDVLGFGGLRFRFSQGRRLLGRDRPHLERIEAGGAAVGEPLRLPLRFGELPFGGARYPVFRPLGPGLRTHPLRYLATANRDRVASFLYRADAGIYLAALDQDLRIERSDETLEPPRERALAPGSRLHAAGLPHPTDSFEAGGLRDLRSFRLYPGERSVLLALDTAEVLSLSARDVARLAQEVHPDRDAASGASDDAPLKLQLALAEWRLSDRYLHFRHASTGIAGESFGTLEIARDWARSAPPGVELVSPQGRRRVATGRPFWLGSERRAALRLDVLRLPAALALLGLLLVPVKVIAGRACSLTASHVVLAGALELLLMVRLLLGYRVWAGFPFEEEAWDLALVAWAVLPWCLLAAALPGAGRSSSERLRDALPVVGGAIFALAWTIRLVGPGRGAVWAICLLGSGAALIPRTRRWRDWWSRRWHLQASSGARGATPEPAPARRWRRLVGRARRAAGWRPRDDRGWVLLFCGLALAVFSIRLILVLGGARESVALFGGLRLSLSLVHVPVLLLLEAWYLGWLWDRMRGGTSDGLGLLPALGIILGGWLLPSFVVSDFGLALVNVAVLLLALAGLSLQARRRNGYLRGRALALLPTAILVAYLLMVSAPFALRLGVSLLPGSVQTALEANRNYQRFLAFAYPGKLEQVGRRTSEEMAVMRTVLDRYTRGEHALRGRGYFGSELSPHIEATALREHAPAIFLVGEWGLLGALGVILAYLAVAGSGVAMAPFSARHERSHGSRQGRASFAGWLALLAALTLAIPSLYMILANYGLVLFTGRNAYLLGLDSNGDVIEALLLLVLTSFAVTILREEEMG